jgi:phage-related protein
LVAIGAVIAVITVCVMIIKSHWSDLISMLEMIPNVISVICQRVWNHISDFIGFSPSHLGLGIVRGIISVEDMLFDALTHPFDRAFDFIQNIFHSIFDMLRSVIPQTLSLGSHLAQAAIDHIPGVSTVIHSIGLDTDQSTKSASVSGESLTVNLEKKMDELISLLKSGNISTGPIYLDGKQLVQGLTRATTPNPA